VHIQCSRLTGYQWLRVDVTDPTGAGAILPSNLRVEKFPTSEMLCSLTIADEWQVQKISNPKCNIPMSEPKELIYITY
jgi:hypothetical protein